MTDDDLVAHATAWIECDPDPVTRGELEALVASRDLEALAGRFEHPLTFGTAGLRGVLGAGPGAMNRLVVRRTTWALVQHLLKTVPEAAERGIVVGGDARHGTAAFVEEVCAVAAGLGMAVHELPAAHPTPLCPFAVRLLGAAAGVQITASHNPPQDNGMKVYAADGAQIISPDDVAIAALANEAPAEVVLAGQEVPLRRAVGRRVLERYRAMALGLLEAETPRTCRIVYTPLHGVGGAMLPRLLADAGFTDVHLVAAQAEPDPDFPTVAFPNPEEPGALDLALALAHEVQADVVLANDPDADRLAVAVRNHEGNFVVLSGDQLGWVLGDDACTIDDGTDAVFATTIVSSTLLAKLCADRGRRFVETLTGFKWIARAAGTGGLHLTFGYEEALGYALGPAVADKDGITAALVVAELVASDLAQGKVLLDRIDHLEATYGVHHTTSFSVRREGPAAMEELGALLAGLCHAPPSTLGALEVLEVTDLSAPTGGLPGTPGLRLVAQGPVRVIVRPSGTEPKLKCYLEVVTEPPGSAGLPDARHQAAALADEVRQAMAQLLS